jgi:tellurite resistance protein
MQPEESEELADQLRECRALAGVPDDEIEAAMVKVDEISRRDGDRKLLAYAAAALPPELRPTAFYMAVDLVAADGEVATEERRFIDRLAIALGIDAALAERILSVALIRNRA